MAALCRLNFINKGFLITPRILVSGERLSSISKSELNVEKVTHTGQRYEPGDYRRMRFLTSQKIVSDHWAIDLIAEEPVVVCDQRVVSSSNGGALGHPKVYINLDKPGVHTCGYSGRRFVHRRFYDEDSMGECITYDDFKNEA